MDSADKPRARFPRPAKRGEGGTQRAQRDAGPRKRGEGNALLPFARPELEAEVERWLEYLAAKRIVETELRAGEDREPWILARDAAVLALLYGSGLRISEALGLERNAVPEPGRGDAILVTGKGNKTRMVPVLQQVLRLVADY